MPRRSRAHLDPLGTPGRRVEGISKVLSLVRHLAIRELHDAHGVGTLATVENHILGYPEIALACDPPDLEPRWFTRVMAAKRLQVMPTKDDLAGLWVLADRIVVIDLMLGILIASSGGSPMSIDCHPDVLFFHHRPIQFADHLNDFGLAREPATGGMRLIIFRSRDFAVTSIPR
jgi:hypothetical protein